MKPYGATAVILEEKVTPETIGQAVYELIKKMEVLDGIWWESLRVFIRRPQAPGTPFDSVLLEEETSWYQYWTVAVKVYAENVEDGKDDNDERYPAENVPDHPEEQPVPGGTDHLQQGVEMERIAIRRLVDKGPGKG